MNVSVIVGRSCPAVRARGAVRSTPARGPTGSPRGGRRSPERPLRRVWETGSSREVSLRGEGPTGHRGPAVVTRGRPSGVAAFTIYKLAFSMTPPVVAMLLATVQVCAARPAARAWACCHKRHWTERSCGGGCAARVPWPSAPVGLRQSDKIVSGSTDHTTRSPRSGSRSERVRGKRL